MDETGESTPDEPKAQSVEEMTFRSFAAGKNPWLMAAFRAHLGLRPNSSDLDRVFEVAYLESELKKLTGRN